MERNTSKVTVSSSYQGLLKAEKKIGANGDGEIKDWADHDHSIWLDVYNAGLNLIDPTIQIAQK